jgi:hypothetical protein
MKEVEGGGVKYCVDGGGGMRREKGKLKSIYAISPSVTILFNRIIVRIEK